MMITESLSWPSFSAGRFVRSIWAGRTSEGAAVHPRDGMDGWARDVRIRKRHPRSRIADNEQGNGLMDVNLSIKDNVGVSPGKSVSFFRQSNLLRGLLIDLTLQEESAPLGRLGALDRMQGVVGALAIGLYMFDRTLATRTC